MPARYKSTARYAESQEQISFFRRLCTRKYQSRPLRVYCYAVPNAGTAGTRQAMLAGVRRKAEGVTAGVPDAECMIAIPPYTGLHIEFKRRDGTPSDVSNEQRSMLQLLAECGRKCVVAFGCDHAWRELCEYLSIPP